MEILFLVLLGFAAKSSWDHVQKTRKASEADRLKEVAKSFKGGAVPKHRLKAAASRHTAGWWLSEAGHGFPVTRRGWHAGWIAHQTEAGQHRARVEQAKTEHAEKQAETMAALPDHQARRAAAQARRDEILAALKGKPEEAKGSREEVQEAADEVARKRAEREQKATAPPLPSETVDRKPAPAPGPYAPRGVVHHDHTLVLPGECPDCGGPGPGIPLVRGDRVGEVREQDGTLVARDAVVLSNDGRRVLLQAPDGRQIDAPSALPLPPTRRADGQPETEADRKFFDLRESGYEGPIDQDGNAAPDEMPGAPREEDLSPIPPSDGAIPQPGPACGNCGRPIGEHTAVDDPQAPDGRELACPRTAVPEPGQADDSTPASPTTGGDTVPTATAETTYDQQLTAAAEVIRSADAEIAELRVRRIAQQVENLATLGLDSGSLSRAAEIDDALKEQEKAAQRVLDAAQAFRDGLVRDHGNVNEAHQAAPQGGAEKAFYQG
jgi:hypothetical protein